MTNLLITLACVGSFIVIAWVSWRAGHDTAMRHADYTISTLRHSLRTTQAEKQAETERAAWLSRELTRRGNVPVKEPAWPFDK